MTTCLTCANWRLKEAKDMARQGFGLCHLAPAWRFLPPQHGCAKFAPAAEATVTSRKAWFSRLQTSTTSAAVDPSPSESSPLTSPISLPDQPTLKG